MPVYLNSGAYKRFLHWITERHTIYLRRQAGQDKPWTDDPILQQYFFTNPYRENDKVTVWFRENIRNPLSERYVEATTCHAGGTWEDEARLPWATVAFRWFNYISTGIALRENGMFDQWDGNRVKRILHEREKLGFQVFTGAYMIKIENARSKIDSCCDQITFLWNRRREFHDQLARCTTLEAGWRVIKCIHYIGPFMAYEVISDLRHTPMFNKATDIMTWCNLGPGAIRGLWRLTHEDDNPPKMHAPSPPKGTMVLMRSLLEDINIQLLKTKYDHILGKQVEITLPQFEMRELEHSLCEFDKYERARLNQGTMKRRYNGV